MAQSALTTKILNWLDDVSGSSGNPFSTYARQVLLGTRLNELATHLGGGSSVHDADEIDYERLDASKKNIAAGSDDVGAALDDLDDATGKLTTLTTTIKTSIVNAINELVSSISSVKTTVRASFAEMLMDQTSPPTAAAGRGQVDGSGNELLVEVQAVPDLTVQIAVGGNAINHQGRRNVVPLVVSLGGFTIPAGGGEERRDIVVVDATGTVVRRVGAEGAPTQADAVLQAGDVPLARILLTQGVDTEIQAVNITDLRSRLGADASQVAYDASGDETSGPDLQTSTSEIALAGLVLIKKVITDTELVDAAVRQEFNFDDDIPAKAVVLSAWFDLAEVFNGGGASAATVEVGDGTDADGYVDGEDVFTGGTLGQRSTPVAAAPALLDGNGFDIADGARTPTVAITSDVNVSTLTQGELTAYILYCATPLGASIS